MDDVQIFTIREHPDCLACSFSLEALMASIEDNLFSLCAAHMLRGTVTLAGRTGVPHLTALPDAE